VRPHLEHAAIPNMIEPRPSVLLVDDDPRTIEILAAVLETQGFDTTLASAPEIAVQLLRTIAFDAVVTDVVFDGFAEGNLVLAATRDLQPRALVVLMTGYPAIENAVRAIKSGANDYVQKPVDPAVLAAFLHRALRERQIGLPDLTFGDLVDILSAMVANTIERVDPYTAGHGARTRKYCRYLAQKLGLEETRTERLELAAIAHDYGKIYLDDLGFLTKNGPLTSEEYEEVKKHPLLGAKKLGNHEHLASVRRFVGEHHERFDGTGYPKRLSGEQISVEGRILCIAEVFDSLATKRSYKEMWELPRTIDFFASQRGKAFDPAVLDPFLDLLEVHGERWIRAPSLDLAAAGLAVGGDSHGKG
jgi:putative two-component system response regulator